MRTSLAVAVLAALVAAAPVQGSYRYVSPRPDAELVNPHATVILHPADVPSPGAAFPAITVRGSSSGIHEGKWIGAESGGVLIFRPAVPFTPGETVGVSVSEPGGDALAYRFTVSPTTAAPPRVRRCERDDRETQARIPAPPLERPVPSRGYPLPSGFPSYTVTVNDAPSPGYLFIGPRLPQKAPPHFAIILDNDGTPVFFRETFDVASDFTRHPEAGVYSHLLGESAGQFYVYNDSFELLDTFRQENGYAYIDGHDFQYLPNGNVLVAAQDWQQIDMSQIVAGGNPNAWVVGLIIQEQDPSHNVVFEWRSWDHFQITDAVGLDLTAPWIDYVHFNAFEPDTDGNILFSCREMNSITKIDRSTGDILWRFGGSQNDFTLVGDTVWIERQHSIRRTPTGTITIFDNGAMAAPWESRAVEYSLDEVNMIATLVWEYRHDPPRFSGWGSNVQRLANGNTMIDWTPLGILTEVTPGGTIVWELELDDHWTYRVFRFDWNGVAARPELWYTANVSDATLYFTKFQDLDVARYNIYVDDHPGATTWVGSTTGNSFVIDVAWPDFSYVRVTAEDMMGVESPYSNERAITGLNPVGVPFTADIDRAVELYPNRPNPFGSRTTIAFVLPQRSRVDLSVFDVTGRLVRTLACGVREQGVNRVAWDGQDSTGRPAASGVYFYRLSTGDRSLARTLTRLR